MLLENNPDREVLIMKLQNKSRLISLAAIFICALTAQVQAGFFDDLKNKASSAAKQVVNETVEEVVGNNPNSLPEDTVEEPGKEPSFSDQDKPKETVNTNGKSSGQLETVSKKILYRCRLILNLHQLLDLKREHQMVIWKLPG